MWWLTGILFALCNVVISQILLNHENNSISCVTNILKKYYKPKSDLTVVNLDNDSDTILKAINNMEHNVVYSRTAEVINKIPHNAGYLIIANSSREFAERFEYITQEVTWNPYSKMIILVKHLNRHDLKCIFDILLSEHVTDVVVINNTHTGDLYTYNPFENYNCGRRYDRIITLGRCNQMNNVNLFSNKIVTGLKGCTIRVTFSPLPPYVFDPNKTDEIGLEQFIFASIAEKEEFKMEVQFKNDVDEFSTILNNRAVGALRALQTNESDVIIGSMLLTAARAEFFTYLAENSETIDYLTIHVATAQQASSLKNIYLEFEGFVWLALLLAFVVYSLLIFFIMKKEFNCVIFLKLFGFLLLQGNKITGNSKSNSVIIFWIFFAYIINCYYHSSLVSLMGNPFMENQISSENDIWKYNLKPCISNAVRRMMQSVAREEFAANTDERCDQGMAESIRVVVDKRDHFAISLLSVYEYHETEYDDEDGNPAVYTIQPPISYVIYACYMYKGFPMPERIQQLYLRLGEAGLISHHFEKLKREKKKQYEALKVQNKVINFFIPWALLAVGVSLALTTFFVELIFHKLYSNTRAKASSSDVFELSDTFDSSETFISFSN